MPAQMFTTVVAVPGTPQRVTKTDVPAQPVISGVLAGQATPRGSILSFQASAANTAGKSIFIGGPTMSVAALTGIGLALLPGQSTVLELSTGTTDAADFWIDTDSTNAATEKVFVLVIG
jgi:hypothetical protein